VLQLQSELAVFIQVLYLAYWLTKYNTF